MVTTCLQAFRPSAEWQQAGLLCYGDETHFIKCVREFRNGKGGRLILFSEFGSEIKARSMPVGPHLEDVWLRIVRRGQLFQAFYSRDGATFHKTGELPWTADPSPLLGLVAKNGDFTDVPEIDASFDFFEVRALRSSNEHLADDREGGMRRRSVPGAETHAVRTE